jgi:predicted MFS family arabinose efflux permease
MLPLIAKCYGSVGFGIMVTAFGLGALVGAGLLPYLRRSISVDAMVAAATLLYAAVTAATGYIHQFHSHCAIMFFGGAGWIVILASLNVSAQICAPSYLRARTLSMYLIVLQGGLAVGASLWGAMAERFGMPNALSIAAFALVVGLVVSRKHRLFLCGADTPVRGL